MNYRHAYMRIVAHAKKEEALGLRKRLQRSDPNYKYYEKHHILPRSIFPLWKDRKSNLVLLTAREHFFCHQLLVKIYENDKEKFAKMACTCLFFIKTTHHCDYKISSREYERIKQNASLANSIHFKGRKQTKEWIEKRTKTSLETRKKNDSSKKTKEQKEKQRQWALSHRDLLSRTQKAGWTDEVRKDFSKKRKEYFKKNFAPGEWAQIQKKRCGNPEIRKRMSVARKGKTLYESSLTGERHYFFRDQQPPKYFLVHNLK